MIQVGIIDDNPVTLYNFSSIINQQPDLKCNYAYSCVHSFLEAARGEKVQILLLDIKLSGEANGISYINKICRYMKGIEIIIMTSFIEKCFIIEAFRAGAVSFYLKKRGLDILLEAIRTTAKGESYIDPLVCRELTNYFLVKKSKAKLSQRERQVIQGLADGLSYKLIAARFEISENTVRQYIRNIYRKLNVNTRTEVINLLHKGEI